MPGSRVVLVVACKFFQATGRQRERVLLLAADANTIRGKGAKVKWIKSGEGA